MSEVQQFRFKESAVFRAFGLKRRKNIVRIAVKAQNIRQFQHFDFAVCFIGIKLFLQQSDGLIDIDVPMVGFRIIGQRDFLQIRIVLQIRGQHGVHIIFQQIESL